MKKFAPELQLRQFVYERKEWERLLAFLQQETTAYKSRLAEIAEIADKKIMITAEKFQDDFIAQDRMIKFLSEEVHSQSRLLADIERHNGHLFYRVEENQKKIRRDIKNANIVFSKVRRDFSNFLNYLF